MTKFKIYQINMERDEDHNAFLSKEEIENYKGSFIVESDLYDKVYEGELNAKSIESIFVYLNSNRPKDYYARSLSVSDVVEIMEGSDIEPGFYFCDSFDFAKIDFDATQCGENIKTKEENKITALKFEVGKAPKVVTIGNDLESLQHEVDGYIEQYMPYEDEVALIVNEEGKMYGKPLNRAVYDEDTHEMIDIVAGDFLIVYAPYDSENFESLPEDMIEKYKKQFEKPEQFFRLDGEIKAIPYEPKAETKKSMER